MNNIYYLDVSSLNDPSLFNFHFNKADTKRQNKINRLRFQKDKNLSLGSDIILRYALNGLNIDLDTLKISYKENKKPYFENENIYFNLSHSNTKVMCAISNKEIGCDVEAINNDKKDIIKIAKKYFTNNEYDFIISAQNEDEQIKRFFRLWTLKESFIKNVGLGLLMPLNSFNIEFSNNKPVLHQSVNNNTYYLYELFLDKLYSYSFCSLSNEKPNIKQIDIK